VMQRCGGESSKGVERCGDGHRGARQQLADGGGPGRRKRIEPQDRNRDATSPRTWTTQSVEAGRNRTDGSTVAAGSRGRTTKPSGGVGRSGAGTRVRRWRGTLGNARRGGMARVIPASSAAPRRRRQGHGGRRPRFLQPNRVLQRESLEAQVR
jgi:hypothetical protein